MLKIINLFLFVSILPMAACPGAEAEADAADSDAAVADDAMSADTTAADVRGVDTFIADAGRPDNNANDTRTGVDTRVNDAGPGADTHVGSDASVVAVELNPGWIGGACSGESDCDQVTAPTCELDGFPDGMCSLECTLGASGSWVCPDTDYGDTTLNTVTRCIDTGIGASRCVAECDFDKSPNGCRPGYVCVLRERYQQAERIFPVCLPAHSQSWPGESALTFDIGTACDSNNDCESLLCLDLPNGYCAKSLCEFAGCPDGSTCFNSSSIEHGVCLKDCAGDNDCRVGEGYECDTDDTCMPGEQPEPTWDPSVGTADCASVWPNGLSSCDLTGDDYVVVRKSVRNMALCNQGAVVDNFYVGLGFDAVYDKVREGDGRTPHGVFYVSRLVPSSSYYKAFVLSYPDSDDADRGLASNLISQSQYTNIVNAQATCTEPPSNTPLGGLVEIHGMGGGSDWTLGCIAIDNDEVDQLWAVMGVGDTIVVLP